ncbi:hypothetical protein CJ030_MR4G008618 [Morella rubra]|uniref:Uncharacterized protein n=1 Tax=Morella rubra TaxID=262757 RepID=A0A6A1VUP1_9ROSI|nr:hypothetical protein CJ030_MR4G008618 [Morella rubra]
MRGLTVPSRLDAYDYNFSKWWYFMLHILLEFDWSTWKIVTSTWHERPVRMDPQSQEDYMTREEQLAQQRVEIPSQSVIMEHEVFVTYFKEMKYQRFPLSYILVRFSSAYILVTFMGMQRRIRAYPAVEMENMPNAEDIFCTFMVERGGRWTLRNTELLPLSLSPRELQLEEESPHHDAGELAAWSDPCLTDLKEMVDAAILRRISCSSTWGPV